jgi:2-oxoglutarate dehydrogenase E2 component (dihydrolipoamide succinyltransferase)
MDGTDGRGRGGLVSRADVAARLAARSAPTTTPVLAADGAPIGAREAARTEAAAVADPDVVPFSSIRRRTAEHLTRSLATAAHTLVTTEADYSAVDEARRESGLTYLPFVARAVVDALHHYPHLNASVVGDGLRLHPHVNLGIAVDLDFEGLIVPVVHRAEELRLRALADRITDLADRARRRRLKPEDVEGGTFTITNPGGYGTVVTGPIINQPQVAIVSTDGVRMRPAALPEPGGGWQMTVRPTGNLSMSFDHRAVDGAYASAFLAAVRDALGDRDWRAELS